ncbi:MAG: hypothetical protein R6V67_04760 [Spirochaetia bacterium]
MEFVDEVQGFGIADPDIIPLSYLPRREEVLKGIDKMILSASGWRKVFAENGDEESFSEEISPENCIIAGAAALSFAELLENEQISKGITEKAPAIAVAVDTRPTGPAIADAICRSLISKGIGVRYLFISPAPEIIAYVKSDASLDGFIYITASHNPVGHNGIKFGLSNGAVAGGEKSRGTIEKFISLTSSNSIVETIYQALSAGSGGEYRRVLEEIPRRKKEASEAYDAFVRTVAAGSDDPKVKYEYFRKLEKDIKDKPLGIAADLNGSARTRSIDGNFLKSLGIHFAAINGKPRQIVHPIVPEGKNLDMCREFLLSRHREDSSFLLGYVPDNDGDRGNIVYYDEKEDTVKAVEAQAVFALSVFAELSDIRSESIREAGSGSTGLRKDKLAVVVNGPTSMRIERIAELFSAEVYRTETGEANVVSKAEGLRRSGYNVRILGEGSNGGNITHPAVVRDPLNTLISIVKLLSSSPLSSPPLSSSELSSSGDRDWSGPTEADHSVAALLDKLPPFVTTGAYEQEAKLKIATVDHGLLKKRYEDLFLTEWEKNKTRFLHTYGIASWREVNYEGTEAKEGFGPNFRSGKQRGGLKLILSDINGRDTDFIWMRGSGTEAVFRVLVDCEGTDRKRHDELLQWHRSLIERADSQ